MLISTPSRARASTCSASTPLLLPPSKEPLHKTYRFDWWDESIDRGVTMASRVFSRFSRSGIVRRLASASVRAETPLSNGFTLGESGADSITKLRPTQVLRDSVLPKASFQRFGFSSSASPQSTDKEANQAAANDNASEGVAKNENGVDANKFNGDSTSQETADGTGSALESEGSKPQSSKKQRRRTKRTAFSDSDSEADLSNDELIKLVAEKEELLNLKQKEIEQMQDKVLRSYAEMENVIDRTKREADNSKKFAVQAFAKGLLDVADNLGRAQSVVKESFSKIDTSKDSAGAVPLLKTLLDGVEMTEKQLGEVFRKFGVEKYDPVDESFDPHRHNAVFQIPDASKPAGTVAVVLKSGYMLYDRVLRPAEVGVTQASNDESPTE